MYRLKESKLNRYLKADIQTAQKAKKKQIKSHIILMGLVDFTNQKRAKDYYNGSVDFDI